MTPTPPLAQVCAVGVTGRGLVRPGNEDAILVFEWHTQSPRSQVVELRTAWVPPVVCALADGLGGHAAGELASRLALGGVAARYGSWTDSASTVDGLAAIDASLYEAARHSADTAGMGATIAGVVFLAGTTLCFNVGDSRVYRIVAGYVEQISVDDTAPGGGNRVSQALGGGPPDPPSPHVTAVPLPPGGDRYLLCSDGAFRHLDDGAFRLLCRNPDLGALVRAVRDAAHEAGAPDNVSIVGVDIPPTQPPDGTP